MPRNILLVEDDERFVSVVASLLEAEGRHVHVARDVRAARDWMRGPTRFGLALVDLALPDGSGVELVRELCALAPPVPALVLTGVRAHTLVIEALRAGASGYLFKDEIARRLVASIDELFAGGVPLSSEAAKALVASVRESSPSTAQSALAPPDVSLTQRERDVLSALTRGLTYEQIGVVLDVSENTIRTHVRALYRKLDVSSRTEAVLLAARYGFITLD